MQDPTHLFGLGLMKEIKPEKNDHTTENHVGISVDSFIDDPFYFDENYFF